MAQPKDISSRVLLVIDHRETDRSVSEIRIIEWTINGKRYTNLEKRDLFRDDSGQEKLGKAKGFNRRDYELITSPAMQEKIMRTFGVANPKPGAPLSNPALPPQTEMAGATQDF